MTCRLPDVAHVSEVIDNEIHYCTIDANGTIIRPYRNVSIMQPHLIDTPSKHYVLTADHAHSLSREICTLITPFCCPFHCAKALYVCTVFWTFITCLYVQYVHLDTLTISNLPHVYMRVCISTLLGSLPHTVCYAECAVRRGALKGFCSSRWLLSATSSALRQR